MPFAALIRLFALALLPVAALAFAACDDDGDGDPGSPQVTVTPDTAQTPDEGGAEDGGGAEGVQLADPDLQVEAIEGVDMPTQIAFIGPDDMLVTEKDGDVVRVTDGQAQEEPVLSLATNYADERGVLGIATHPGFEQNNYVYIYWTWTGEGDVPDGLTGEASEDIELVPENGNRVDRFVWDGERLTFDQNIIELPSRVTDLTLDRRRGNHNGGVIKFGDDGKLYAVIGDQNVRGELTNVQDGETVTESGLVAVVLRLNDDGSVPEDNPFVGEGDPLDKVYVYGVRNSFGFDFHPDTGDLWLEVNGQAAHDVIGRYPAGSNVGWIQILGPVERFDEYKAIELPTERQFDSPSFPPSMLAASADEALARLFELPGSQFVEPEITWKYAVAPAGMHFIEGDALGAEYAGDLLVGDVNTGTIWRFDVAPDGSSLQLSGPLADGVIDNTSEDLTAEGQDNVFGSGFFVGTDIKQSPDGALYITSLAQNAIYRITAGGGGESDGAPTRQQ
ncbi:MAG TPA: PQQ-dependent sugar dehydrogenase [Dehalococcoidia bacterium]|nr:PQQ-dependent sugar dehydrogenase [Dehalococcoidia bacterium]